MNRVYTCAWVEEKSEWEDDFNFFDAKKELAMCCTIVRVRWSYTQNTWMGTSVANDGQCWAIRCVCSRLLLCCCHRCHLHYCLFVWSTTKKFVCASSKNLNWISTKFCQCYAIQIGCLSPLFDWFRWIFDILFALQISSVWAWNCKWEEQNGYVCVCVTALLFASRFVSERMTNLVSVSLPIVLVCLRYSIVLQFGRAVADNFFFALIFDKQWNGMHTFTYIYFILVVYTHAHGHDNNKYFKGKQTQSEQKVLRLICVCCAHQTCAKIKLLNERTRTHALRKCTPVIEIRHAMRMLYPVCSLVVVVCLVAICHLLFAIVFPSFVNMTVSKFIYYWPWQ